MGAAYRLSDGTTAGILEAAAGVVMKKAGESACLWRGPGEQTDSNAPGAGHGSAAGRAGGTV